MANSWQSKRKFGVSGKPQFSSSPSRPAGSAVIPVDGLYTYDGRQFLSDFSVDISQWPVAVDIAPAIPGSVKATRALHSNDAPIITSLAAGAGALPAGQTWVTIQSFATAGGTTYEGVPDQQPPPFGTTPVYPSYVVPGGGGGITVVWPHAYGVNWNGVGPITAGYHVYIGTSNGFVVATQRYTVPANGFTGPRGDIPITTPLTYVVNGTSFDTGPAWTAGTYAARAIRSNAGNLYQCVVPGISNTAPTGTAFLIQPDTGNPGFAQWTYVLGLNVGFPSVCFFSSVGQAGYGSPVSGTDPTRWQSYGKIIGVDNNTPFLLIACGRDPRKGSPTYLRYFDPNSDWPARGCPYPPDPYIDTASTGCFAAPFYGECDSVDTATGSLLDDPYFWRCPNPLPPDTSFWLSRDYVQSGFLTSEGPEDPLTAYHDRHIFIYNKQTNELACIIGASGHGYGWTPAQPQMAMGSGAMFSGNVNEWNNPKHPQSHHRGRGSGASNLPEPPGCTTYEEIFISPFPIPHGHLMNVNRSRGSFFSDIGGRAWVYPASGSDGTGGPNLPPIGSRWRMKSDARLLAENGIDLSSTAARPYSPWLIKYFRSYQTYGFIICDSLFFGQFVSRGQFIPSFIGHTGWNAVGGPYNQTSDKQLGDEWFWMCRADGSIGGGLAPANPIDINCFECIQLGLASYSVPAGQPAIAVFGDPKPG